MFSIISNLRQNTKTTIIIYWTPNVRALEFELFTYCMDWDG